MKKEDFISKYCDSIIRIPINKDTLIDWISVAKEKAKIVLGVCNELGLSTDYSEFGKEYLHPNITIYIYQNVPSVNPETSRISFEEFEEDYRSLLEHEGERKKIEFEKDIKVVMEMLRDMLIETGTPRKIAMTPNVAQETGFIQGESTNYSSLWWHPDGRRIFFLCGRGCFELSNYMDIGKE